MTLKRTKIGLIIILFANLIQFVYVLITSFFGWIFDYYFFSKTLDIVVEYSGLIASVVGCVLAIKEEKIFRNPCIVAVTQLVLVIVGDVLVWSEIIRSTTVTITIPILFEAVTELFVINAIQTLVEKNGFSTGFFRVAQVSVACFVTVYILLSMGNWLILFTGVMGETIAGFLYAALYFASLMSAYVFYVLAIGKGIRLCGKAERGEVLS